MAKFHYRESPSPQQNKAFSQYLSEDEELILVTGFSGAYIRSKFMFYLFFPGVIFAGIGFGLGTSFKFEMTQAIILGVVLAILAAFLKTFHHYHANRYILTSKRLMIKKGLFGVKLSVALYDKITHLEVDQSFMDRVFLHHGDVIINTAGINRNEIILKSVDYPMEIKNLLERLIHRERDQSGGHGSISAVEGEIVS